MDILETKGNFDLKDEIKNIMKILKFKNNPIELKGSGSLKSQEYFSDYDFLTKIKYNYSPNEIYDEFKNIISDILRDKDLYFIELKIQKDKKKYRWYPSDNFDKDDFIKKFKDALFVKLDIVSYIDKYFIDISCIYDFSNKTLSTEDYISNIQKDIKVLKKERKFYKILKRLFSIYKVQNNKNGMLLLTKTFNSDLGALYKKISNIEAIENVLKYYNDDMTKHKVEINFKEIKESPKTYKNDFVSYNERINNEAKNIYKNLLL